MATWRYKISLQALKNISLIHSFSTPENAIYYVGIATLIFSDVEIICYFSRVKMSLFYGKVNVD